MWTSRVAAVDTQGNIYVTEHTDCRVRKVSPERGTLGTWGSCGAGQGHFHDPEAIAVDLEGNIYVADRGNDRMVKLAPSGDVVRTFGSHRILDLSPGGTLVGQLGAPGIGPGEFDAPQRLAVDSRGWLYVADTGNNRVQQFGP